MIASPCCRQLLFAIAVSFIGPAVAQGADCVVLLHGLARSSSSMDRLAESLERDGFAVVNVDYPSREFAVEDLAGMAVDGGLKQCPAHDAVHFVTHSLGGILIRYYLERFDVPALGRVVMLAPPNQGSEVVDNFRNVPGFAWLNGPAGNQLGTDPDSIPAMLGPVDFDLGIVAGSKTINYILSQSLPNPDDGKVSVERTKVAGMRDFIVVPHSHPFIMRAPAVIEQVIVFIRSGHFDHERL